MKGWSLKYSQWPTQAGGILIFMFSKNSNEQALLPKPGWKANKAVFTEEEETLFRILAPELEAWSLCHQCLV